MRPLPLTKQAAPSALFAGFILILSPWACVPPAGAQAMGPFPPTSARAENRAGFSSSLLPLDALTQGASAAGPAPISAADSTAGSDAAGFRHEPVEPYPTNLYQAPWSRIGVGADVSPLGVGIKSAVVLNTFMDARAMGNFFNYNSGRFEVDGFNVYAHLHLASAEALVDVYPWASVWRISAGLMFFNGNQLSGTTRVAGGTSFTLDGETFYSANSNPVTGATPITGSGVLGLHTRTPAFIVSGGFGKFVPRSERHWSFPSEFGVIFTGAPTINVNLNGWACINSQQTECSNLSNAANPVTVQFNNALQGQLNKWRRDLKSVPVYPIFSYGVMYSFDTPWSR